MTRRPPHDDPLGEALAGGAAKLPDLGGPVQHETTAPVMVDLDQFVVTAQDRYLIEQDDAEKDDEPVVAYDDEARGGRVYHLLHAPRVNGELLDLVTLRLPEQGDIDAFFAGSIAGNRGMICRLTGLHPAVFARLKWPDAQALHQLYRDIVPGFVTGEE